jgi:adenylate kinase
MLSGEHLKASDLIRFTPDPNDTTGKAAGEVWGNQERLIAAIDARRTASGTVLLDGHFCLLDHAHVVVRLPIEVFERIQPIALLLVESDVAEAVDRIKQRDGRRREITLLQDLAHAEREHALAISEALDVPIMSANAMTNPENIAAFLRTSSKVS